jgi:hypothetical protein
MYLCKPTFNFMHTYVTLKPCASHLVLMKGTKVSEKSEEEGVHFPRNLYLTIRDHTPEDKIDHLTLAYTHFCINKIGVCM